MKPESSEPSRGGVEPQPADAHATVSVVIPVYNSWTPTLRCLESLRRQRQQPTEVIVVDDGSEQPAPALFRKAFNAGILKLVRIGHNGVSAARNAGLHFAAGSIVLFIDSDCTLDVRAVERLAVTAAERTRNQTFQLCIDGDITQLVGTAEHIYNSAVQEVFRRSDGTIAWLNTAGFAVRRAYGQHVRPLFDVTAVRAQDTLLLAKLMADGDLPWFVPDGVAFHSPSVSPLGYICKAYHDCRNSRDVYAHIKAMDLPIRANRRQQRQIVRRLWCQASTVPLGRRAFALIMARHLVKISSRLK